MSARIESGMLSVAPQPVDLTVLVEQARSALASGGARHAVSIDLPRDLPRVMADTRRIVQVLNNLLSNAARHSPESAPIRVEAALEGHHVAVLVADQGSGVPPHLLPHMFSKHAGLVGGDGSLGFGLGLAICKGLVEAHGGRISARSGGQGQGTRITFTIPAVAEAGNANVSEPPLVAGTSEGPRAGGRSTARAGAGRRPLRRSASSATRSPPEASRRWSRAVRVNSPASSERSGRTSSCSTWCCPERTASNCSGACRNWPKCP